MAQSKKGRRQIHSLSYGNSDSLIRVYGEVRRLGKEAVYTTYLDYSLHLLVTERRHGPLSKLYTRAPPPPPAPASSQKCHVVNGQGPACRAPGSTKTSSREKGQGSRSRGHQPPEKTQKDNLCLFVPVVNLEKMSSLPKPDGHGIRVAPPSAFLSQPGSLPKDSPGKAPMALPSKEPPGRESIEIIPGEGSSHRAEGSPPEKEPGGARLPPKTHRKMARE
ncbi:Hypothetical predicted protein [Marmota monax]|uniref:Uncharacterized protein n=1 Tax=Marmota monax TaxID=9995 RepID=A0A5E4BGD2_MARMO|nr:hypothetical protein GHT09_003571 [Marmota monax]VTJ68744.1 Hypothetical predicted protein [Marmota monax]